MTMIPYLLLGLAAVLALVWLGLHWRYHIRSSPLNSVDGLQGRLGHGRAVLVQFHAPL